MDDDDNYEEGGAGAVYSPSLRMPMKREAQVTLHEHKQNM